jgi:hypothetical protein
VTRRGVRSVGNDKRKKGAKKVRSGILIFDGLKTSKGSLGYARDDKQKRIDRVKGKLRSKRNFLGEKLSGVWQRIILLIKNN